MGTKGLLNSLFIALVLLSFGIVEAENDYKFYTWTVTYGIASPLNIPQTVILINGQFPGPRLDTVTNDNLIINVINKLDEPFLLTWNGIKQRKNSWQDGVLGTNCPIPSRSNFTYKFQTKDQIGTYSYFPSTSTHKFAGGFGGLNIYARSVIAVPYPKPVQDFTLLMGDWYKISNKALRRIMDSGKSLPFPDGILINGRTQSTYSGDQGKTYMFRITNIGFSSTLNFRIQGHKMKVVEVEGSHVMQNMYDSLDLHVGQSMSVLVTLDQPPKDYYIVASSRFTKAVLTATAVLHYTNSKSSVVGPVPSGPTTLDWSLNQARSLRWNLTANAARPNPQGSFHYGTIKVTRSFVFASSAPLINEKQRYAVNGVSYINSDTPLKLADYFNIGGVFSMNSIQNSPQSGNSAFLSTSVVSVNLHDFMEVVFQNNENSMQSWHLDGYDFWVVGYGSGKWTPAIRKTYNLVDAPTRHTAQVYPNSWTTILVSLDNQGMWNVRSALWERQYLGQQFYLRVFSPVKSLFNEYDPPTNLLLCGKAVGRHP